MNSIDLALQTEYKLDGFIVNLLSDDADIRTHLDMEWVTAPADPFNDEFVESHHTEVIATIDKVLAGYGYKAEPALTANDLSIDIVDIKIVKVAA